ncbi:porin family protein [Shewanella sp. Isolate11]|nr:porin family protein [Shewanella sp. Isolate11]
MLGILAVGFTTQLQARETWFIAPFAGYDFGTNQFEASNSNINLDSQVKVADGEHVGVVIGVKTREPGDIYLLYSHQSSELRLAENFMSSTVLSELDLDYMHVGGSLYFPTGNLRPYVTVSIGFTQMRPSSDYSNETRFSMGFGAGVEYQFNQSIALFVDARGYSTFLSSDNDLFCQSNKCVWHIDADMMWQAQVNAGLKISF